MSINIMDPVFNGMGRSELYRSQVFPELFPHEGVMMLHNWPEEDLAAYCGGEYTEGYGVREWVRQYNEFATQMVGRRGTK